MLTNDAIEDDCVTGEPMPSLRTLGWENEASVMQQGQLGTVRRTMCLVALRA